MHLLMLPGCRYWSASPPPLRLTLGSYPRMDTSCPPVGMSEQSWAFRMWTMLSQAKFWLLSGLLSMFGQSALAAKLWTGWLVRCSGPAVSGPAIVSRLLSSCAPPTHVVAGLLEVSLMLCAFRCGAAACLCLVCMAAQQAR